MRLCYVVALTAASLGAGFIATASAADLGPVSTKAPPAVVPDWVGFYVGIHGGGGWGHTSFDPTFSSNSSLLLDVTPPSASPKGGVFGGQVGYNWQWGPAVGGLEVDFSGADLNDTAAFSFPTPILSGFTFSREVKIEELASARGRLGYLPFPNLLLYGTAGVGWGHSRLNSTQFAPGDITVSSTSFSDEFGWVAGAGLEWMFWDHWFLRGEWLHYDFGWQNNTDTPNFFFVGATTPPFATPINSRNTVDVGRAALSYKF